MKALLQRFFLNATVRSVLAILGVAAIATTVTLTSLSACGASAADKREATLRTAFLAVNVARDEFVAWDDDHQQAIVAAAPDEVTGRAVLESYREKRALVIEAFEVAYKALADLFVEPKTPIKDLPALKALKTQIDTVKGL